MNLPIKMDPDTGDKITVYIDNLDSSILLVASILYVMVTPYDIDVHKTHLCIPINDLCALSKYIKEHTDINVSTVDAFIDHVRNI